MSSHGLQQMFYWLQILPLSSSTNELFPQSALLQNSLKSIRVALKTTRIVAGLPLALTLGSDIRNNSNESLTSPPARATHLGYAVGGVGGAYNIWDR